jgi:prepilin-type N-terminal cleavage/methylation domain-containing protein
VTVPRTRRRTRRGQRGLTLIELLVTIALMGVGFLSLLAAFSTIEVTVGATSDDAQLASQVRQVEDYVQSEGFVYIVCGDASGYQAALHRAITSGKVTMSAGYGVNVIAVAQASGGNHTVSGANRSLSPINGCSGGPAAGPDYGVQQIQLQVASAHHSLTRIVYKRWN